MTKAMNDYTNRLFGTNDATSRAILQAIEEEGLPQISVSPAAARWLTMLVSMTGAERVLEIGALGGYSGLALLRGLPSTGTLTSLELNESYAHLAKRHLEEAGFQGRVSYEIGDAMTSLAELDARGETYDFFFIDANKDGYADYVEGAMRLARPGALIVLDNVFAGGSVYDDRVEAKTSTPFMKRLNAMIASRTDVRANLLPIGDGFLVIELPQ